MHHRCAGLDISKKDVKVCVRTVPAGRVRAVQKVTTWSSMTAQVLALREYLIEMAVTCVVMEATGDYWKPFYYVLEDGPFEVMLVNAHEAKNVPGRKTDVSDAAWLAQLGAHGLLRASFVPPPPVRQLRDLTRARTQIVREQTRETNRLEKILEDAGIKLSLVATDITGVSARRILRALVAGERDPQALAQLSVRALRRKIPQLEPALQGRFTEHHGFMVEVHLDRIEQLEATAAKITDRIEQVIEPFRGARELISSIPGISTSVAEVIIAETGADMDQFPTPGHRASWAGVCPGHNESAGRVKSAKTRPGNRHLKGALGIAAMSNARHKGTHLHAKYKRIAKRRGRSKALVAIEHHLLTVIWTLLRTGAFYQDPGPDYYTHRNPNAAKKHALRQLQALGYDVTLHPHTEVA